MHKFEKIPIYRKSTYLGCHVYSLTTVYYFIDYTICSALKNLDYIFIFNCTFLFTLRGMQTTYKEFGERKVHISTGLS